MNNNVDIYLLFLIFPYHKNIRNYKSQPFLRILYGGGEKGFRHPVQISLV
jgi:hypothetical protein